MKVFHHIFNDVINLENLVASWREFRVGKKAKRDVLEFERNLEDNLWQLHEALKTRTYRHAPYESFYIQDPKLRHIHKASVRDRVLHHAIVKQLNPIFESVFIPDSYSCRTDKGTHRGVERFVAYSREVSRNFIESCWVLKCDIKKFFASIDHSTLLKILFRRIQDPDMRWLLEKVVEGFRSDLTTDPNEPKGLPIGNLTSQLFANVYLNEFDQFIKHDLREKYYIRYADDFVVPHPQRQHILSIAESINNFLVSQLKLQLHPRKIHIRKIIQGVDFLGYLCFPHHVLVRPKTQKRIFRKIRHKINEQRNGRCSEQSVTQSLHSYSGVLSHANSYELSQTLKNQFWFWLNG